MAFSEHLLGLTIFTTPIIWLTGDPLLAYNVAFFLSFVLSAHRGVLSRLHDLAPARLRISRRARIRLCAVSHGAVRARAGAVRLLDAGRAGGAASLLRESPHPLGRRCSPSSWLLQALACGYYLFYLSVLIGLWLLWFCEGAKPAPCARSRSASPGPSRSRCWCRCSMATGDFSTPTGCAAGIDEIIIVQRRCRQRTQGTRQSSGVWGWLNVVHHPEADIFPGLTVVGPRHSRVGDWLAQCGEGADRPAADRACICRARGPVLRHCGLAVLLRIRGSSRSAASGCLSVGTPHKPLSVGSAVVWSSPARCTRPVGPRGGDDRR